MTVSDSFFDLIEKFEGFVPCPYFDDAGVATIGIGTTYYPSGERVKKTDTCISREDAVNILKLNLTEFIKQVDALTPDTLTQNQFDALVSFSYNEGTTGFKNSTMLKKIRINPNDPSIANEFLKWDKVRNPKTHILEDDKGLLSRRKKESALYFTPIVQPQ